MDPILEEIYTTVMPAAPYVIAAYVLIWLILGVYIVAISRKLKSAEAQMAVLEDAIARRGDTESKGE